MSRATRQVSGAPWAARAVAGVLVAASVVVVSPASADDVVTLTDVRTMQVEQSTQLEAAIAASAPAAPKKIIPNFVARTTAAIRATRSASLFRYGTPAYAKWYAKSHIVQKYKWGATQYGCLVSLWKRESSWRYTARNRNGKYFGIPQTSKATITGFGTTVANYMRTPELQVQVGAKYVKYRYNSPCTALKFATHHGWY